MYVEIISSYEFMALKFWSIQIPTTLFCNNLTVSKLHLGGGESGLKMGQSTTEQAEHMDCENSSQKHNTICEADILRYNTVVRWLVFMLLI